ncbi:MULTISPECIES: SH3 domain-containing C40 family peptidase [unclassified Paenibacillus]|uniref:SH3 domain-containing C40 family peptidase n=1 Tax=unclassified Paenibacillus TaxID=185978 RepID=UPI0009558DA4|nr:MULTISPECIES: SH3 domain-containing C40 family peptidase [unclassified Paenibacillus]ASS68705.2 SH3 domain-containing protein [Paenibacillus sp. RUD330]SIR56094.1 Cell wall-associated hydrolase, NlpC family [Paenibacillus sp. RU4X]SIR64669.1 Cell wall-associated hydrolase, NlpC family [Paenibacillus sp. RU4T]
MNKSLAAAVLAASLALGIAAPSAVSAATQKAQTQGNVNLRAEPATAGKVLRTLPKGEQISVLQRVDNYWLKVQDKSGTVGYVSASSSYITMLDAAAAETVSDASAGKPAASAASSKFASNAKAASTVALRVGPSTASTLVRYLKKDEQIEVKSIPSSYWYQIVDASGKTGYVSSDAKYITVTGTLPGAKSGSTAAGAGSGSTAAGVGSGSTAAGAGSGSTAAGAGSGSTAAGAGSVSTAAGAGSGSTAAGAGSVSTAAGAGSVSSAAVAGSVSTAAGAGSGSTAAGAGSVSTAAFAPNAVAVAAVTLRKGPSSSYDQIRNLKSGESIQVTAVPNSYWYMVKDAAGVTGYVSSDAKYISVTGTLPGGGAPSPQPSVPTPTPAPTPQPSPPSAGTSLSPQASEQIEAVINAGLKYLGTPYEYGSSRSDTSTFDCSDFVRQAFLDALSLQLPVDSRGQGQYVLDRGAYTTDWNSLKRGDLMFFVSSGTKVNNSGPLDSSIITHVGMYLGDNKILQTYSKESGGVQVTTVSPTSNWQFRFLFGGSAV